MIAKLTIHFERLFAYFPLGYYLMLPYYKSLVRKEIYLANIQVTDTCLFVGSGPYPITAILVSKFTNAQCVCLDISRKNCETAAQLVKKAHVNLSILCGDGRDIDISKYTLIHVAKQVMPHTSTVNALVQKATPNTRILVRYKTKTHQLNKIKTFRLVKETALIEC